MPIHREREWMYTRITSDGYLSFDFEIKVDEFLDTAFSKEECVENKVSNGSVIRSIKCPCTICETTHYRKREVVKIHLLKKGFMRNYTTWWAHGETSTTFQQVRECSNQVEDDENVYGCRQMVLDNMYPSNLNFRTFQSNLDSNAREEQVPNPSANQFYEMLQAADEPLWNGCNNWSKLQAATRLLNWKSKCNIPEATFNEIVSVFKSMLPDDNKLAEAFYETKKCLKKLRLRNEKIHACKNHCMLFYKEYKDLSNCQWCGESRYKSGGRNIPNLVLTYMPIADRLQRLYMCKKTAQEMTWHADHETVPGSMAHPSDNKAWNHFDSTHPLFAEEIRNVRLGLCTDGFSPNNTSSNPYSLWPVFLTIYNLPPWMALKESYVKLCLVIPGKKSPGQNLDVFLRTLIDELKMLYDDGVETYDAYRKDKFTMRAILLWTISDFPAYAMLSGWSTHGKLACPCCMGDVDSFQLQYGGKPCWFDCHRRFLPSTHPFRNDRKGFRAGTVGRSATPPIELTGLQIWEQICDFPTVYDGVPYSSKYKKPLGFGITHNWVKKSIFWELPYWHTLLIRHNLDVMHIEKNVFENLFHTVMDTSKTKDNIKARKDLERYCARPLLHTWTNPNNKVMKPKASYTLTKLEVKKVCEWLKNVKFPDGYASNIGGCVNLADCSFYSFKSHDCHVFMQRLLPIALRGMIPNVIWDAITELCTFFCVICSRVLHINDLEKLQESIIVTICKLEKVFPPGFFDSMEHLIIHLTREAILGGHVQYRWMYLYERKLGSLKRTVRNKAGVEGSIVESYLVNELSTYCSLYFEPTVATRLNREPRNFAPENPSCMGMLSIFKVPSRRLFDKGGKDRPLSDSEMHKVHTYILLNCREVHPFIWHFDEWVKHTQPWITIEALDLYREKEFAKWFKIHVMKEQDFNVNLKDLAQGPMRYVKSHNGYFVNGYKFHTVTHGHGYVTQNSGVCVKGTVYNEEESDYYGLLEEVLEVEYHSMLGRCVVVLFKCSWFDPIQGVKVNRKYNLVDVKHKSEGCINDPFVLASQAQQVYYSQYPSTRKDLKDWWVVVKTKPRSIYEISESVQEVFDDEIVDGEHFFQDNERFIDVTITNEVHEPVSLVQGEVDDNDLHDINNDINDEEEKFVDTFEDPNEDAEMYLTDSSG